MDRANLSQIKSQLDLLTNARTGFEAEQLLYNILPHLFQFDGYVTRPLEDVGIDFVASKRTDNPDIPPVVGIQVKHYRLARPVGLDVVDQLARYQKNSDIHQAVLLSRSGFTARAVTRAASQIPPLQLWTYEDLHSWFTRIERSSREDHSTVIRAITELSKEFAAYVAENPRELDNLAWLDMERMLAAVFDGLGFRAKLTPPSKDGGKDVILECTIEGEELSYIVEIKHWRSGQRVGKSSTKNFVQVVAREQHRGGLFLSTYGYSRDAFQALTASERQTVRFGNEEKIVTLCRTYVKAESALWKPNSDLVELLYEKTQDA